MLDGRGVHFALTGMAFLLVTAVLAIFFAGALPANQETQNWTVIPSDWEELRRQWEYSHAINALLILIAFSALALEAVLPDSSAQRRPGAAAHSSAQVEQGEAEETQYSQCSSPWPRCDLSAGPLTRGRRR